MPYGSRFKLNMCKRTISGRVLSKIPSEEAEMPRYWLHLLKWINEGGLLSVKLNICSVKECLIIFSSLCWRYFIIFKSENQAGNNFPVTNTRYLLETGVNRYVVHCRVSHLKCECACRIIKSFNIFFHCTTFQFLVFHHFL